MLTSTIVVKFIFDSACLSASLGDKGLFRSAKILQIADSVSFESVCVLAVRSCCVFTSAEREVKVSQRSGMYQSYNFLTRLGMQIAKSVGFRFYSAI